MRRSLEFAACLVLLAGLLIPFLLICLLVKLTSRGPVFHVSDRIGVANKTFRMYKFRTMRTDTPQLATHLLEDRERFLTPIGGLLRKTSLDELPQLFNILKGDMSLVGPRPALFNQDDLIELRTKRGVHKVVPGVTGWAQVNGRDELPIPVKVEYDAFYVENRSLALDMKILWKTASTVLDSRAREAVR